MKEHWVNTKVNIGVINAGDKFTAQFPTAVEIMPINVVLKPSCGCTSVRWNEHTKNVIVEFTASKIPKHLESREYYPTSKFVVVDYDINGSHYTEILTVEGIVKA